MKFNSQICTTKIQSQLLLALGLKPETADMCHFCSTNDDIENPYTRMVVEDYIDIPLEDNNADIIPAWSLHRLIEICSESYYTFNLNVHKMDLYDFIINIFEHLKNQGKINKEYLK